MLRNAYRPFLRGAALVALTTAISCSSASPTGPTNKSPQGLGGTWNGTTFQGRPITFTLSNDNRLTALSVGYQIDACTGTATFTNLDVAMLDVGRGSPTFFGYSATVLDRPDVVISVQGSLMPDGSMWGGVIVYGKPACGRSESVAGMFQANRT